MPKASPAIFTPTVNLGSPDFVSAALPSLSTVTPVASAVTTSSLINNDIRPSLDTTATYQFAISLFGYDKVNGGYTVGAASQVSNVIAITAANQVILLQVPNASWPANTFNTPLCAIWMKKNSGNYTLCQLDYIDPNNAFNAWVPAEFPAGTPVRTLSFIQNASGDSTFGTMAPYGTTSVSVGTTSGGVNYNRTASQVSVSPDNAPDYQIVTSRGCDLSFSTLSSDPSDIVKATAGLYVSGLGSDGKTYNQTQQTILTAAAKIVGNRHIIVNEQDSAGNAVTRIFVGNLTASQQAVTISRTKTAVALLNFTLATAAVDSLLNNLNSEISYSRF